MYQSRSIKESPYCLAKALPNVVLPAQEYQTRKIRFICLCILRSKHNKKNPVCKYLQTGPYCVTAVFTVLLHYMNLPVKLPVFKILTPGATLSTGIPASVYEADRTTLPAAS